MKRTAATWKLVGRRLQVREGLLQLRTVSNFEPQSRALRQPDRIHGVLLQDLGFQQRKGLIAAALIDESVGDLALAREPILFATFAPAR